MMWFVFGLFVGTMLGIMLMCLMSMASTESECTGDCNQGRNCTCMKGEK